MTIVLHGMNSPNVRKVALMLEELGLDYALRHVAVFRGEQFTPAFLALNPLGKVPVLEDPALGAPLAESGAILMYLAETYGGFLAPSGLARYEALQWLMVQMASIGPMLGQLNHFQQIATAEDYSRARYTEAARRLYAVLDARLATRTWIAGGDYSIADIATWPWATYLERHGFAPKAHSALIAWRDRIAARPATQRMLERTLAAFSSPSTEARTTASPTELDRFFGRTADMAALDYSALTR